MINLHKAFDTTDHKILIEEMICLGFAEPTIRWYKSHLTNKCFIVNVGKDFSPPGKLSCGVPQASILGPLLFLLHVNDMPQTIKFEIYEIYVYGKDINMIEEQLNTDLSSLCDWFIDKNFEKKKQSQFCFEPNGN